MFKIRFVVTSVFFERGDYIGEKLGHNDAFLIPGNQHKIVVSLSVDNMFFVW